MSCGGIADSSIDAIEFLQGIGLRPGLESCFGVGLAGRSFNALFNSISVPRIVITLPQLHPENYFFGIDNEQKYSVHPHIFVNGVDCVFTYERNN